MIYFVINNNKYKDDIDIPEDSVDTMEMFEVRPSWIETTHVFGEDIPPGSFTFQI